LKKGRKRRRRSSLSVRQKATNPKKKEPDIKKKIQVDSRSEDGVSTTYLRSKRTHKEGEKLSVATKLDSEARGGRKETHSGEGSVHLSKNKRTKKKKSMETYSKRTPRGRATHKEKRPGASATPKHQRWGVRSGKSSSRRRGEKGKAEKIVSIRS